MTRSRSGQEAAGVTVLLLAIGCACAVHAAEAVEVFPVGEEPSEPPRAASTTYWKVRTFLTVEDVPAGGLVRMHFPMSDGRQAVVMRRARADKFDFREGTDGLNLWGEWTAREPLEHAEIECEAAIEVSDRRYPVPTRPLERRKYPPEISRYLKPSDLIQSDAPAIRTRARDLTRNASGVDEAAWALYQFTASFLKTDGAAEARTDALTVLRADKASVTGRARLLAAFFRSLGIPARLVGGLRLKDAAKKRATIAWVEAYLGDGWVPFDPGGGHFASLPNTYMALYRGDLPLMVHTATVRVDYGYVLHQVSRRAVFEREEGPAATAPVAPPRREVELDTERVRTVAAYVEHPAATVVVIADQDVAEGVVQRIMEEARGDELNVVLLNARFQSRYFREQYLQRLVSSRADLIGDANLLLVATADDAGLYALMELGEHRIRLRDARIMVAGAFPRPVGAVLGTVLFDLLDPGELILLNQRADLLDLWEVARANLVRGEPLAAEAAKWGFTTQLIDEDSRAGLPRWREMLVNGWTEAVRSQVPLQVVALILSLPMIALVVVIGRHVIGIEAFGTFSPVIVSLAFLMTGLYWGVAIFVVIVGVGALVRSALQRLRLHLVARLAILMALVALLMTALTVVGAALGIGPLLNVSIFPMVIMSNVIENFAVSQMEFGTREAIRLTRNTLALAVICYLAVASTGLQSLVLAFPELVLGAVGGDILLGKWRGLRLLEYFRFYELMRGGRAQWPAS